MQPGSHPASRAGVRPRPPPGRKPALRACLHHEAPGGSARRPPQSSSDRWRQEPDKAKVCCLRLHFVRLSIVRAELCAIPGACRRFFWTRAQARNPMARGERYRPQLCSYSPRCSPSTWRYTAGACEGCVRHEKHCCGELWQLPQLPRTGFGVVGDGQRPAALTSTC